MTVGVSVLDIVVPIISPILVQCKIHRRTMNTSSIFIGFLAKGSKMTCRLMATKPIVDGIIRVDHAGELAADRIYAGQVAVLGGTSKGPLIRHMWEQEKGHRARFEELVRKYRVRPTVMTAVWDAAGFALGFGSAMIGEKAAMACTVAVETVIVDHYNDQLRTLMADPESNRELLETITKFRDEEQEHHDTGIDQGAEQAPFYTMFSQIVKIGCKTAIAISKVM